METHALPFSGISTCIRHGGAAVLGPVVWTQRHQALIPRSALSVTPNLDPCRKGLNPRTYSKIIKDLVIYIMLSSSLQKNVHCKFHGFPLNLVKQHSSFSWQTLRRCASSSPFGPPGASTCRVLQPRWRDGIHGSTARRDDFGWFLDDLWDNNYM